MFGAKVLRGSPAVDKLLDKALAQDALAPAEGVLLLAEFVKAGLFDLKGLMEAKKKDEEPTVEVTPPVESVVQAEPAPTPAEEPEAVPDVMAEPMQISDPAVPQPLNRLKSFSHLSLPEVIVAGLKTSEANDSYFEAALDFATVRANTYLDIVIREEKTKGRRSQLDALLKANGSAGFVYVYDVKSRLRTLNDDLIASPFKRPVPINQSCFKAWLQALWCEPKARLDCMRSTHV